MKIRLSSPTAFFKRFSVLSLLRILAMTAIGLSAMSFYSPLRTWVSATFTFRPPTMLPSKISFLIIAAIEAALFIFLSKKFKHWLWSLLLQVVICVAVIVLLLTVTRSSIYVLLFAYLYVMPIGYSAIIQLIAVVIKELCKIVKKPLAYCFGYGICALVLAIAFILPFTQPTPKQLCDELTRSLHNPKISNLKWSYSEGGEMERISEEQWEEIFKDLPLSIERPQKANDHPTVEGSIHLGCYIGGIDWFSNNDLPFVPYSQSLDLTWSGNYAWFNYKGERIYIDCNEFIRRIEPYITPASE